MEAQLVEEQELLGYECEDGSQLIIATTDGTCDISAFAEGQVVEVLHEPGSGNIFLQANFDGTAVGTVPLHQGLLQLQQSSVQKCPLALEVEVTNTGSIAAPDADASDDSDSNAYKCSTCGVSFATKKTLKLHSTVHVDDAFYACEFCSASKIHWTEMWLHQCINIEGRVPIICSHCHKELSSKKQLQVHEEVHDLQRRFTSKRMEGYFQRKLQDAEDPIVDWGAKPFICGVCGKPFARLYELEYHEKLHTGERPNENVCKKCSIPYINRHDLNKHKALGCNGQLARKTDGSSGGFSKEKPAAAQCPVPQQQESMQESIIFHQDNVQFHFVNVQSLC